MEKLLVFDMDGTIADFYGVENWLNHLKAESTLPYEIARPLYNMVLLNEILNVLKNDGWKIVVTTWLAKNATKAYDDKVRAAKKEWLDRYNFPYDELHMVRYGTTKANCTRKHGGFQILVDDNSKVRSGWTLGAVMDANENIVPHLQKLIA